MQVLENYLSKLDSLADNASAFVDPLAIVEDLDNLTFQGGLSESDLTLCSSLLFAGEHNVLRFLKKTVMNQEKSFVKTKEAILIFISKFIKFMEKKVQDYALDIKDTCYSVFRREQSNIVKIATFKPISKILELKLQLLDGERLGIREMAETYLREFTYGKVSQTVKSLILQLLGTFTEYFSEYMSDKSKQLLSLLLESLKYQFKSKKPDMQIISGSLKGMSSFLIKFSGDFTADPKNRQTLYQYVCLALEIPSHVQRYDIPKAGLRIVSLHAALIKEYLTEDSVKMYSRLLTICKHQNDALREAAFSALESFLKQVSNELTSGSRNIVSDQETFKFFIRKFYDLLESQNSDLFEISIAIRGFGHFAKPMAEFAGVWELKKILGKLFTFNERFNSKQDKLEDTIHHLSSFISSISNVIHELDNIDEVFMESLETVIGTLFLIFPQLYPKQRTRYYHAISKLLEVLYEKGSLSTLLSRIVLQALLVTCSTVNVSGLPALVGNESTEVKLHDIYYHLWKQILQPNFNLELKPNVVKGISTICYDELVQGIVKLIQKLDLSYIIDSSAGPDLIQQFKPNKGKDFNLVHFCKLILPNTHPEYFTRWVFIFGREVISKSNEHPLVSGFYRLLTIAMKISEKQNYFSEIEMDRPNNDDENVTDMQTDEKEQQQNARASFSLFSKFIKDVVVRVQQYKYELLAACVELVLSVPKQFVDVPMLVSPLQLALKIGLSYVPLANIALDALEYWIRTIPDMVIPELPRILPSLNDWISFTKAKDENQGTKNNTKLLTMNNIMDKKKGTIEEVQIRVVRLLGTLGGRNADMLSEINLSEQKGSTSWDLTRRLKFAVPFKDLKPEIWLDSLLPRIVELAENASDRQAKVAACESLHSLIIFILGAGVTRRRDENGSPMKKLYEHLFPCIVNLSCDVDTVTRQLFEPLMFQTIHLFTRGDTDPEETMILVDSIVDTLGHPTDGGKRDFSAKCLSEFLTWSIKHSSKKQQEQNPFNAKSLFKRLYGMARHPNPYKRLGCASTFNHVYRTIREEESLVDQFLFEIIHNLIFCLRLCHSDDENLGTIDSITTAIRNMAKIIPFRAELLNIKNNKRRQHQNLSLFVDWLFKETGRHEIRSRAECMRLFKELVILVPGVKSASQWVQQKIKNTDVAVEFFDPKEIVFPSATLIRSGLEELNNWLTTLITSLDCYIWAISEEFTSFSSESSVPSLLVYFLDNFALLSPESITKFHTQKESEKYHKNKCTVIVLLFKFLQVVLEKKNGSLVSKVIGETLFRVLVLSLLAPSKLGFSIADAKGQELMYSQATRLLKTMSSSLDNNSSQLLRKVLQSYFNKEEFNLSKIDFGHNSTINVQETIVLINGYKKLHSVDMLFPNISSPQAFVNNLVTVTFDNSEKYSPLELLVAAELLNLSFAMKFQDIMKFLLDETVIQEKEASLPSQISLGTMDGSQSMESSQAPGQKKEEKKSEKKKSTKGEIFYLKFQTQIDDFILSRFSSFARIIMSNTQKNPLMIKLLLSLIDKFSKDSKLDSKSFLAEFFTSMNSLANWALTDSTLTQKSTIVELLKKLLQLNIELISKDKDATEFIRNIFIAFLSKSLPLTFKTEVLDLLPFVISLGVNDMIKEKLVDIVVYDFPSNSHDVPEKSITYNVFIGTLDKLLDALEKSGSLILLECLFPTLRERQHVHADKISEKIRGFIQRMGDEEAKKAFEFCFQHFTEKRHDDYLRLILAKAFCSQLIERMSSTNVVEVFSNIIEDVMSIVVATTHSTDVQFLSTYYAEKIGAFLLMESLYKALPGPIIKDRLNKRYYPGADAKGNELTTAIMRAAHNAKTENTHITDTQLKQLRLEYQCTAYNSLASIVMTTQNKENFFTIFFFKENIEKGELIWEHIVDVEKHLKFEIETNFPTSSKTVAQLRQENISKKAANSDLRYISSQYLADSSLSQDLQQKSSFFSSVDKPKEDEISSTPSSQQTPTQIKDELELDEINSNPCMPIILDLIHSMEQKFGSSYDKNEMPKWMFELHSKFTNPASNVNIRLFILKIVINRPESFKNYSTYWLRSIMRTAILDLGSGFNYFVRDVCILFLKWGIQPKDTNEDRSVASQFMNLLVKNSVYTNREILKANLRIIRLLCENWKDRFVVHKKTLFEMLSDESVIPRLTALQILSIFLANGYPLLDKDRDTDINEFRFWNTFVGSLNFQSKEVYTSASELCGLSMKLKLQDATSEQTFMQLLQEKINSMFAKAEYDRVLTCLHKIGENSPKFIQHFTLKIFSIFPKILGEYKAIALQLLSWNVDDIEDLFTQLQPEVLKLLSHRNDETQLLTLKIILQLLPKMSKTQILFILEILLSTFHDHTNPACREVYYDILTWLFNNIAEIKNLKIEPQNSVAPLYERVQRSLLRGLFDESEIISKKIFDFYDKNLSSQTIVRLMEVFDRLYSPEIEENWLNSSTRLLLQLTARSPDFDRVLYEAISNQVEFKEYKIDTSFSSQPMTPLFSQVASQEETSQEQQMGGIRATLTPQFATAATLGEDSLQQSASFQRQHTVLLRPSPNSNLPTPGTQSKPSVDNEGFAQPTQAMIPIRKRFDKQSVQKATMSAAKIAIQLNRLKSSKNKKSQARNAQIVMFRKYRTGELPDIQIKSREIIEPLQALAKKDSELARILFTRIFNAIFSSVPEVDRQDFQGIIGDHFTKLLRSTSLVTPFVSCILGICFEHPEIKIPSDLIGDVSLRSFNFHSGIMLLEKQILYQPGGEKAAKKRKSDVDEKQHMWLSLAKLYKNLGEEDILRGLFEKKIAKNILTRLGLAAELRGDYVEALGVYEKAVQMLDGSNVWEGPPPTPQEEEYWENARLECLRKLTRWKDLADNTVAEIEQDLSKLWQDKYIDPYLGYFIQSHSKEKERWPDVWKFVASSNNEQREVLEKRFGTVNNDLDRARYFVGKSYEYFLNDWSKLHSFDFVGRRNKLQTLQRLVELEEFLSFVGNEKNFMSIDNANPLLDTWRDRYPSKEDSIINWDDIITDRACMVEKLLDRYVNLLEDDSGDEMEDGEKKKNIKLSSLKAYILQSKANSYKQMATAARKQLNFYVADNCLRLCLKSKPSKKAFMFPFFDSLVKLFCLKAEYAETEAEKIDKMAKALIFIEKKKDEEQVINIHNYRRKYLLMLGDVYKKLADLSVDFPDITKDSITELPHLAQVPSHQLSTVMTQKAQECFDEAINLSRRYKVNIKSTSADAEEISQEAAAKAFLKYALFCDDLLKSLENNGNTKSKLNKETLPSIVITNILEAMSNNSRRARDRFPRLLEIIANYPSTQGLFIKKSKEVPIWMFIRWISQMTAVLDKPEGPAVVELLVELAKQYPQAVYFPFKISSEDLKPAAAKIVAPLNALLSKYPMLNLFVTSLEKLTHPEHRFKDRMEELKPFVRNKKKSTVEVNEIKRLVKLLYEDVFDPKKPEIGSYNKKLAEAWENEFLKNFGNDGSKLMNMDSDDFLGILATFNDKMMKNISPKSATTAPMKLSDFSNWLADFEQSDVINSESIELPGQYTGASLPHPEHHIKISSFDSNILVLGSLRKPKRLKIRGNDEKDYPFLVKGGEDLRLDQRVQQMFTVMNEILSSDTASSQRRLKIATYKVIPMTSRVGILEWVLNTKTLKEVVEEEIAKDEGKPKKDISILKLAAANLHNVWIHSFEDRAKRRTMCDKYYAMFQYANRSDVEKQVNNQHNTVRDDLLRRGIMNLSSSPEAYLSLRSQFAKSLAVFNIASYILGIGDRHLENFLLNLNDGGIIGIDFGHAFGTATQFLPIPELIPFRLTRQFMNFLQPLDADGLLKYNMVHSLAAFQQHKDIILNVMDVFIKEPLIDWEKFARRLAREQGADDETSKNWFPKKKIEIAKRKLNGDNPAYITLSELKESIHAPQDYMKHLQQIVLGDATHNIRARIKEKCGSAKDQVDCLVDQASDPNILGRTYFGWAPWV